MPTAFSPIDVEDPYTAMTDDSLRLHVANSPPTRAPGSYVYSNLGMALLGRALAHASGVTWWELVQARVLEPLEMREVWVDVPGAVASRLATGHTPGLIPTPHWHFAAYAPAGAIVTSAPTLSRLLEELALPDTSTAIGRAIVLATQPLRSVGAGRDSVALGWHVQHHDSTRIIWHNGGTGGFRSWMGAVRGEQRGAIVLSNAVLPWVDATGVALVSGESIQTPPMVVPRTVVVMVPERLAELIGRYPLTPAFVLDISLVGDRLFVQATAQPKVRLLASAPDQFFLPTVPDAELRFERDSSGAVVAVVLRQGGIDQRAPRQP
jgi:CubicO group peptidase (beta-lactamase class C family)